MTSRDPIPQGYNELESSTQLSLEVDDGEMLQISEAGIDTFLKAVRHEQNIIADSVTYKDIPFLNGLRTPAMVLGLRNRRMSNFTITVPRKDVSTAITIDMHDEVNPNRRYIFTEVEGSDDEEGGFVIDDTDWLNAEKADASVDTFMNTFEVAQWLYRQAGIESSVLNRTIKREQDPVQDASHKLSIRADQIVSQRQVKVPVVPGLFFYGEEISVIKPDELLVEKPETPLPTGNIPIARPTRVYNLWINNIFDTEKYGGVRETITCSFSPDNPALYFPNPRSTAILSLETTKRLTDSDLAELVAERQDNYRGNIADVFTMVGEMMESKAA